MTVAILEHNGDRDGLLVLTYPVNVLYPRVRTMAVLDQLLGGLQSLFSPVGSFPGPKDCSCNGLLENVC